MKKIQVTCLLFLASFTLGTCNGEIPKPSYTRTMLKVSRSLPGETEELKVRTSEGNVATLIVKKRDRSSSILDDSKPLPKSSHGRSNVTADNRTDPLITQNLSSINNEGDKTDRRDEVKRLENAQVEQIRVTFSKRSDVKDDRVFDRTRDKVVEYGHWTPLDAAGRTSKQEITEEEYRNWKPLQTSARISSSDDRAGYDELNGAKFSGGLLLARNFENRAQRNLQLADGDGKNEEGFYYTFLPHQSRSSTRTNIGANLSKNRDEKSVPPEVIVRSEINVKAVPKRAPMSLDNDGTPVIHGTRIPDEPIDKVQTWRNARVINNRLVAEENPTVNADPSPTPYSGDSVEKRQRFEKFFKDINRRYGRNYEEEGRNVYFEWDPRNYKNEALKAEVYEARNDHYRTNVRKRMLQPDGIASYPISQRYTSEGQTIAPVALKPGARAPVLQYAHPELGVQPAKILKNEKRRPDNFPENQHSFTEQRHKKKYVLNDKNIVDSYTLKNYYPNQHFYGLKRPNEPPFWVKISENLRNQFSTGVEKVSQFTRPVIDPLVEATHKISQNLGLSKGKEAQDKIGTVASGTSILIPALGLVASGAALGIGAVAVGRYLDVDVLKRSNGDDVDLEHKRALEAETYSRAIEDDGSRLNDAPPRTLYVLQNIPENDRLYDETVSPIGTNEVFLLLENGKRNAVKMENRENAQINADYVTDVTNGRRRKRSSDYLDIFGTRSDAKNVVRSKRFQRKGADSISEIVEIDLPSEGRIDIPEFFIPKRTSKDTYENTILVIENASTRNTMNADVKSSDRNSVENSAKIIGDGKEDDGQEEKDETIDSVFFVLGDKSKILENNVKIASIEKLIKGPEEAPDTDFSYKANTRKRRSIESDQELEDALQNLENAEVAEIAHIESGWTNTPCAKRIFCDAMIQRGPDASMLMEKKMAALLGLIQPGAAVQVSSHFEEVMNAVRRHDCSSFLCPQARPGNVFF